MKLANLAGTSVAVALVIVTALATVANASDRDSAAQSHMMEVLTDKGLSSERATEALNVQGQVATANLISALEAALGEKYAEVWLEPSAAQLHIGVTTAASRTVAEKIVRQADMSASAVAAVTYTSVRSTRAQLLAAQKEWSARLAPLFTGQQVGTAIDSSLNAVAVKVSSSVPPRERDRLKHEAASASVNVVITIVPPSELAFQLRSAPSTCPLPFLKEEAYCSATLTSGVLITPNKRAKPPWKEEEYYCTAGPLGMPKEKGKKLETYVITAGHCIKETAKPWYSSTPGAGQKTEEIGLAVTTRLNETSDYGDILVKQPGFWTEAGLTPVFPGVVKWTSAAEKAFQVEGEEPSAKGLVNCHQGATSSEQCGIVLMTGVEKEVNGELKKGLVEDEACGEGGDSGGPWINTTLSGALRVDGTEVGGPPEKCVGHTCTKCKSFYEPIKTSLEGLGLELLTKSNEKRLESTPLPIIGVALPNEGYPLRLEGGVEGAIELINERGNLSAHQATVLLTASELTSLGAAIVKWSGVEDTEGAKCNTAGDAAGVVLVPNAEFHFVYDSLSPGATLEAAELILFTKYTIECGVLETTVTGPATARIAIPAPESGKEGDSTSLATRSRCANSLTGQQEVRSYYNDALELVATTLLANISGTGNVKTCEETPTVLLKVASASTATMFSVLL
jgi:hypothetical protein